MSKTTITAIVMVIAFASTSDAKDVFDVYGKKGNLPVCLHAVINSMYNDGYIREAGNYDNGKWDIEPEVPCGDSRRFFEVWSRFSTISPPGIGLVNMKVDFTLTNASDVKEAFLTRAVKGTLKRRSHFKGEDFELRIHLECK